MNEPWPPNYVNEYIKRQQRLLWLRQDPEPRFQGAKLYYSDPTHAAEFIEHWCVTYDPRNAGKEGLTTTMPFVPFKRQRDLIDFLVACLQEDADGLAEKCRDMGATWICCAFSVWLWLFMDGTSVGWGSREQDLVDKLGDIDSIFEKMRKIIQCLPVEFLPKGLNAKQHLTFMKLINPENGASITGDIGDNIGRGGRKRIYFKDESAHYVHAELIEASLGDTTRVQIDISSVNGNGNVFQRKRDSGKVWEPGQPVDPATTNVFVMDWRDHPAKDQAWYDQRRAKAVESGLLHVFEQEVNRNYNASVAGIIINPEWVKASIDAHLKLGFDDTGGWVASLDVGDSAIGTGDANAFGLRKGVVLRHAEAWHEEDTGKTSRRAIDGCRDHGYLDLQYDSIGVGSGVKAEANRLQEAELMPKGVRLVPWNAGLPPLDPDEHVERDDDNSPLNKDFYANLKAQGWWQLRRRFERTWRAVNEPGFTWRAEDLISIDSSIECIRQLEKELCQPTRGLSGSMKLMVNKTPPGTRSPNLGDMVMMLYWPLPGDFDVNEFMRAFG